MNKQHILITTFISILYFTLLISCGQEHNINTKILKFNISDIQIKIKKIPTSKTIIKQFLHHQKKLILASRPSSSSKKTTSTKPNSKDTIKLSNIINTGKNSWPIILDNKPVVNINVDYATAIPAGIKDSMELQNFSNATFNSYEILAHNIYGMEILKIEYTTIHQYGGDYQGKGKYLTSISVIPTLIDIGWGMKVNFTTKTVSVSNVGTQTNPIASAIVDINIQISHLLKYTHIGAAIQFRGDSALVNISGI